MAKALDMTQGKPGKILISFALPLVVGNFLNQVYSLTDSIIVGRVLGQTSLAAIGVCSPVVMLTGSLIFGLNIGVGIIFSQCVGEKNVIRMKEVFANSIYIGLLLAVFMAVIGIPLSRPILTLMGTPDGPMRQACGYMQINFATSLFPIFYFLFSNIARGMGDSYTSLYCLIVSVCSNILLDLLFVAVLDLGVNGSAWATALAQAMSVVFAYATLYRKYPDIRLKKSDLHPQAKLFRQITVLALPIALQTGFNNLGNIVVQSCVNGFGEAVMAAYTAASRLSSLFLLPVENLPSALSVYVGQNYGAKKPQRIRDGARAALRFELIMSIVIIAVIVPFGRYLTCIFLEKNTAEILAASRSFLLISTAPCILDGIMSIVQQVLRGAGKANQSVVGGFMQLGAKVAVALLGAFILKNSIAVWFAWPISYIAGTIYPLIVYRKWSAQDFQERNA